MLPPDLNVTTVAPNPAPGYTEYVKQQLHIIAVGMGVTYEMLTGDMREVNFSSSRVRQADFRRQVESRQWLCLVPRLILPVWRSFINAGVLSGKWRRADYACDHSMPKWDYVNPQQDANSELTLIGTGLLTISESLRRRGYKPEAVFAELKSDFDKLEELGVLKVLLALQGKKDPNAEQAGVAQDQQSARMLDAMQSMRADLLQAVSQSAATRQAAPAVDFGDAVINVTRTETIRAPDVHVHVPQQPAPDVTVTVQEREQQPPQVTVPVTVQPADVNVNVRAVVPPRRTETTIETNERGDVVRTVSVEKEA
ncbi:MAG: Phage capsid and scaffold [Pseudomonadota bacterium]